MTLDLSTVSSLGQLIDGALARHPDRIALIEADRDRPAKTFTHAEFSRTARALAEALESAVRPGDPVAILMSNQSKWLFAATAAFYRGGVVVPLDYKLGAADQLRLLAHSGAKALFVEWAIYRRFTAEKLTLPAGLRVIVSEAPAKEKLAQERFEALVGTVDAPAPDLRLRARDDVACIVYSSGTGGTPKGCMLTHGNYLAQAEVLGKLFPIGPDDRYFSVLPTNHAIDFMCGFLLPMQFGAAVVHQRTLRPEYLASTMRDHGVSHMALVPLLLRAFEKKIKEGIAASPAWKRGFTRALMTINAALTRSAPRPALSRALLAPVHRAFGGKLKLLFAGGAFVEQGLADFFHAIGLPVAIGYGLTEAGTVLTVNDLRPYRGDTVGKPVPGTTIAIRGANAQGVGEVWAQGPTVMKGYLNEPELTRETIVEGWLRTGDLGRLDDDGHLRLVGRAKNMIVTEGGKNVYPEDVEAAFEGAVDGAELCVFSTTYVWPQTALGGEKLLLVVHPKEPMDEAALLGCLGERNRTLADYKRIGCVLVWGREFPRTASMKVKRQELARELAAVDPATTKAWA